MKFIYDTFAIINAIMHLKRLVNNASFSLSCCYDLNSNSILKYHGQPRYQVQVQCGCGCGFSQIVRGYQADINEKSRHQEHATR